MADDNQLFRYRKLDELDLLDLESIRLALFGASVIDWHRVSFGALVDVEEFLVAHELDPKDPASHARMEAVKNQAIAYLRRNFDFPIPKPVADADVGELLLLASGRGHRQLCACTILKVIHVIHHLEARELLSILPISDQDVFYLVEQKVYRVIGSMLARGLPILEFVGGRKNKDSLYSKLLSKRQTHAARIYDKLRFRVVVRDASDLFPVLAYLTRHLFPFNYLVPGESTNTLFDLGTYLRDQPRLAELAPDLQPLDDELANGGANDNAFSAPSYRVVHFVADVPVRVPSDVLELAPPAAWALGHVVFAQTEFQIVDRETEQRNELDDASHDAYKARQRAAVMRRLKVGAVAPSRASRASRSAEPKEASPRAKPRSTKPRDASGAQSAGQRAGKKTKKRRGKQVPAAAAPKTTSSPGQASSPTRFSKGRISPPTDSSRAAVPKKGFVKPRGQLGKKR